MWLNLSFVQGYMTQPRVFVNVVQQTGPNGPSAPPLRQLSQIQWIIQNSWSAYLTGFLGQSGSRIDETIYVLPTIQILTQPIHLIPNMYFKGWDRERWTHSMICPNLEPRSNGSHSEYSWLQMFWKNSCSSWNRILCSSWNKERIGDGWI